MIKTLNISFNANNRVLCFENKKEDFSPLLKNYRTATPPLLKFLCSFLVLQPKGFESKGNKVFQRQRPFFFKDLLNPSYVCFANVGKAAPHNPKPLSNPPFRFAKQSKEVSGILRLTLLKSGPFATQTRLGLGGPCPPKQTGFSYGSEARALASLGNKPRCGGVQEPKSAVENLDKYISIEYPLETYHRSNQDTCLVHKPAVFEGQWIESGDLLADCSASRGGELSLGQNILIGYMPWEGYNFEDAILISERLVYDDLYTSIHIERYEITIEETKLGIEEITREIPEVQEKSLAHLNSLGIAKLGSWIEEGDILIGKVTPINKRNQSNYQKLLYLILDKTVSPVRDNSLRAPKGIKAKVIGIQLFKNNRNASLPGSLSIHNKVDKNVPKSSSKELKQSHQSTESSFTSLTKQPKRALDTKVPVAPLFMAKQGGIRRQQRASISLDRGFALHPLSPYGVLLAKPRGRRTQRGKEQRLGSSPNLVLPPPVFGKFCVKERRVFQTQGTQLSGKLYKKQKTSLKGISSIQIYLAERRRVQVGDKMAGRHGNKGIISEILPIEDLPYLPDGTPLDMVLNPLGVPSRMNVGQIYECLLGLAGKHLGENFKVFPFDEIYGAEASRSFVYSKLYNASIKTGKTWLFNPNLPGKLCLYDGRTGESFHQAITVGFAYILRLVHMVDDKMHCLTPDHDVLTNKGWLCIDKITCKDKIATLKENGQFVYQKPTNIFHYKNYKGSLYHIKNNTTESPIDLLVTPNHRMYVTLLHNPPLWLSSLYSEAGAPSPCRHPLLCKKEKAVSFKKSQGLCSVTGANRCLQSKGSANPPFRFATQSKEGPPCYARSEKKGSPYPTPGRTPVLFSLPLCFAPKGLLRKGKGAQQKGEKQGEVRVKGRRKAQEKKLFAHYELIEARNLIGKNYRYLKTAHWTKKNYQFVFPSIGKNSKNTPQKIIDMNAWLTFLGLWISGSCRIKKNLPCFLKENSSFDPLLGTQPLCPVSKPALDDFVFICRDVHPPSPIPYALPPKGGEGDAKQGLLATQDPPEGPDLSKMPPLAHLDLGYGYASHRGAPLLCKLKSSPNPLQRKPGRGPLLHKPFGDASHRVRGIPDPPMFALTPPKGGVGGKQKKEALDLRPLPLCFAPLWFAKQRRKLLSSGSKGRGFATQGKGNGRKQTKTHFVCKTKENGPSKIKKVFQPYPFAPKSCLLHGSCKASVLSKMPPRKVCVTKHLRKGRDFEKDWQQVKRKVTHGPCPFEDALLRKPFLKGLRSKASSKGQGPKFQNPVCLQNKGKRAKGDTRQEARALQQNSYFEFAHMQRKKESNFFILNLFQNVIRKLGFQYKIINHTLYINANQLWSYLKTLTADFEKKLLPSWVWRLSQKQAQLLFSSIMASSSLEDSISNFNFFSFSRRDLQTKTSSGSLDLRYPPVIAEERRGLVLQRVPQRQNEVSQSCRNYYTSYLKLADDIMHLALHSGWSANQYLKKEQVLNFSVKTNLPRPLVFPFWVSLRETQKENLQSPSYFSGLLLLPLLFPSHSSHPLCFAPKGGGRGAKQRERGQSIEENSKKEDKEEHCKIAIIKKQNNGVFKRAASCVCTSFAPPSHKPKPLVAKPTIPTFAVAQETQTPAFSPNPFALQTKEGGVNKGGAIRLQSKGVALSLRSKKGGERSKAEAPKLARGFVLLLQKGKEQKIGSLVPKGWSLWKRGAMQQSFLLRKPFLLRKGNTREASNLCFPLTPPLGGVKANVGGVLRSKKLIEGSCAALNPPLGGVKEGRKTLFRKPFRAGVKQSPGKRQQYETFIPYIGSVFCLTVPNEVFYIRRNGLPTWTGNSRSTGPYSLVTQQPLRGRRKHGGQRLGEMEVWALEGYGAAFTLLEMLTIKSDDMSGRMTLWSNLILNKEISIGTPESFKVLICELQALCLDIGLFRMLPAKSKFGAIPS